MKNARQLFMIMFILALLGLSACNADTTPPAETDGSTTASAETKGESTTTAAAETAVETGPNGGIVYYGDPNAPPNLIDEIILPADGETIRYPDGLLLYYNYEGQELRAKEAYREGNAVYFIAEDNPYHYQLHICAITPEGEFFGTINDDWDPVRPYDYQIKVFFQNKPEVMKEHYMEAYEEVVERLGDEYSPDKSYYIVYLYMCQANEKDLG